MGPFIQVNIYISHYLTQWAGGVSGFPEKRVTKVCGSTLFSVTTMRRWVGVEFPGKKRFETNTRMAQFALFTNPPLAGAASLSFQYWRIGNVVVGSFLLVINSMVLYGI